MPFQFLDQEHLIRVVTGKPIGRVNVQTVERTCCRLVAKTLQSRTKERATTVAFVDEAQLRVVKVIDAPLIEIIDGMYSA
jgi:hypothetical protein